MSFPDGCRTSYEHECNKEGWHIAEGCKCTYGPDIDDTHSIYKLDERCQTLRHEQNQKTLDDASRSMRQLPKWQRGRNGPTTPYDLLHSACWNLTNEQILDVVKHIKRKYKQ